MPKIDSDDLRYDYNDSPICPYCDAPLCMHERFDLCHEGYREVDCQCCQRVYDVLTHVSHKFSTKKNDAANGCENCIIENAHTEKCDCECHGEVNNGQKTLRINILKNTTTKLEAKMMINDKEITDTERLDFLLKNKFVNISPKSKNGFFTVFSTRDGLVKLAEGKTEREAIDAAMRGKDGK